MPLNLARQEKFELCCFDLSYTYLCLPSQQIIKGNVYNYPGYENGAPITTSKVAFSIGKTFATRSGSRYELGEPEHEFKHQLEWAGLYRADSPLQPLLAMEHTSRVLDDMALAQCHTRKPAVEQSCAEPRTAGNTAGNTYGSADFARSYAEFVRGHLAQSEMIRIQAKQVQHEVAQRKFDGEELARTQLRREMKRRELLIRSRHRAARMIQTAFRIHFARSLTCRHRDASQCLASVVAAFIVRRRFLIQRHSATVVQSIARGRRTRTMQRLSNTPTVQGRHQFGDDMLGEFRKLLHSPRRHLEECDSSSDGEGRQQRGRQVKPHRAKTNHSAARRRYRAGAPPRYLPGITGLLTMCREYHAQDRPVECLALSERILSLEPTVRIQPPSPVAAAAAAAAAAVAAAAAAAAAAACCLLLLLLLLAAAAAAACRSYRCCCRCCRRCRRCRRCCCRCCRCCRRCRRCRCRC
eukprot:SAG11_NODE_3257_length_2575_cov_4.482229_1_plen_466_part_10